jgi:hypothetical protein
MHDPHSPAFYGEQEPSAICPVVSRLFDALAGSDASISYKIAALRCAMNFLASADQLQRNLSPDMLCIPLNTERN